MAMNTDALAAALRKIVRSEVLGPGMEVTLFEDGELVFLVEDETGAKVAVNASTMDAGWDVKLEGMISASQRMRTAANKERVMRTFTPRGRK